MKDLKLPFVLVITVACLIGVTNQQCYAGCTTCSQSNSNGNCYGCVNNFNATPGVQDNAGIMQYYCDCTANFYFDGTSTCAPCHYSCYHCAGSLYT